MSDHVLDDFGTWDCLTIAVNMMDNGALVVDPEGYITQFNKPYGKILGIDSDEQVGNHVTEVVENSRMHIVAQTGKAEINVCHLIKGQNMVVQRIPTMEKGRG